MLKLSRVALHEWEFVYPRIYFDLTDEFHAGCDLYEEMDLDKAERNCETCRGTLRQESIPVPSAKSICVTRA